MIDNISFVNEVAVVVLKGSLDVSKQMSLKADLAKISSDSDNDLVLNFTDVNFIDSSCLGALVSLTKEVRNCKGDIKISNVNDDVRSIFQITRLDKIFEIFDDVDSAVESFYKQSP